MAHLIDRDALAAEIESKKKFAQTLGDNAINSSMQQFYDGMKQGCVDILSFLNTLEMKEVDLEKEFSQWWKSERAKDYNVDILYERYSNVSMKLAKHFFELGIKAQKGE